MPDYEVEGYGRETGRRRKRVYRASTEDEAVLKANEDGTMVGTVRRLPDEPPTDAQITYAQDLGLEFPPGITKEEMRDLLDRYLSHDKPASDRHRAFARRFGVEFTDYTGKRRLFDRIGYELKKPGRERDLIAWFVYRVNRQLHHGEDAPGVHGPDSPAMREIARLVGNDEAVLDSIRQYEGRDLIWFGEWTAPDGGLYHGGSDRTIAYERAAALIRERFPQPPRTRPAPPRRTPHPGGAENSRGSGCLGAFSIFAMWLVTTVLVVASYIRSWAVAVGP